MKNSIIEEKLINFIREYNAASNLYWVPLARLKKDISVVSYDVEAIYENNDIAMLEKVFKICGISNVKMFQMDHREYFEFDDVYELLFERDEDGDFPRYSETFLFDATEKWMIYFSHEETISFTGKEIAEAAIQNIDDVYRLSNTGCGGIDEKF